MNLVNKQNAIGIVFEGLEYALQALLKITAIFSTGKQCAHVQRVDRGIGQNIGYLTFGNAPCQTFRNGGFTYTGLANQQWIIFAATAKYLHHALDLTIAPNKGVDLALARHHIQVLSELIQRAFFAAGR